MTLLLKICQYIVVNIKNMKPKYNIGDEILIHEPEWGNMFFSIVAIAKVESYTHSINYIIGIKDCDKYLFPGSWSKNYNQTFAEYYDQVTISIIEELPLKKVQEAGFTRFYGIDEDVILKVKDELTRVISSINNELNK